VLEVANEELSGWKVGHATRFGRAKDELKASEMA